MSRIWRSACCAAALMVLANVPAAHGQGGGIQVDPDSPSGTEYQLPLERARQDAQQGGPPKTVRPGERTAPAFGEGIQTPPASGKAPKTSSADTMPSATNTSTTPPGGAVTGRSDAPPAKAAGGPGSSLLAVGAIAAGVLALGAAIGLLLRRRTRVGRSNVHE